MQVLLDTNSKFTINAAPQKADGSPGTLDPGTVGVFAVNAPDILKLTPAPDGLSAVCEGLTPGTAMVSWSGTAGGKTITGDDAVEATVSPAPPPPPPPPPAGDATTAHISVGPVTPK